MHTPSVDAPSVPADAYLLDVREPEEWDAGHVEGSAHVPIGEVVARVDELPTDREIVVVCRSGHRSAQVAHYLGQRGLDAVNLDGGLAAWEASGRPLVDGRGSAGAVV